MGQYKYTVYVDDNFHYRDESERYKLAEFDDCAAAIAACQRIVDEFLVSNRAECEDVLVTYLMFGDDRSSSPTTPTASSPRGTTRGNGRARWPSLPIPAALREILHEHSGGAVVTEGS